MAKTTLHNKGKRKIVLKGGEILPGQSVRLNKESADKLLALFPDELSNPEKAQEIFEDPEEIEDGLNDLTRAELKDLLEGAGVEHDANAKKAELLELAEQL